MNGDIKAINSWAKSTACRARAVAQNTGCSVEEATERLIREDNAAAKKARSARFVAANRVGGAR